MSLLSRAIGIHPVADPIRAAGEVFDGLFTSDEERLTHQEVMERLRQQPYLMQMLLNMQEAKHRTIWVAGWRPFIGWVGGVGLAWFVIIEPLLLWYVAISGSDISVPMFQPERADFLFNIMLAMLGINMAARTVEKVKGVTR